MNDCHDGDDPSEADPRAQEDRTLGERVERALDLVRDFLTPEEIEEHRRMLTFLARTTAARLSDDRPRDVPDRSDTMLKPEVSALRAATSRRLKGKARGT